MDRKPAEVCHPGEHLRDELETLGWGTEYFAKIAGLIEMEAHEIIYHERRITWLIAERLSKAFGTPAEFWMNLQRAWDERSK